MAQKICRGGTGMQTTTKTSIKETTKEPFKPFPLGSYSQVSYTVRRNDGDENNCKNVIPSRKMEKHLENINHEEPTVKNQESLVIRNTVEAQLGIVSSKRVRKKHSDVSLQPFSSLNMVKFRREDLMPPAKLRKGCNKRRIRERPRTPGNDISQHLAQLRKKQARILGLQSSTVKKEQEDPTQEVEQMREKLPTFNPSMRLNIQVTRDPVPPYMEFLTPEKFAGAPFSRFTDSRVGHFRPLMADQAPETHFYDQFAGAQFSRFTDTKADHFQPLLADQAPGTHFYDQASYWKNSSESSLSSCGQTPSPQPDQASLYVNEQSYHGSEIHKHEDTSQSEINLEEYQEKPPNPSDSFEYPTVYQRQTEFLELNDSIQRENSLYDFYKEGQHNDKTQDDVCHEENETSHACHPFEENFRSKDPFEE